MRGRKPCHDALRCKVVSLVLGAVVLSLTGCAYSTSPLLREDVRTVYVPVFDNHTFRRGLEVDLTRAVVQELTLRTHLRIAPEEAADTTLLGTLEGFEEEVVTKSKEGNVLLMRARASVRFRWRDNLALRDIVPPQTVTETETIAVARADALETSLFREVAQRIVERLERDW